MHISIEEAIERFGRGEMLIMSDSEERENEGDLIMPAGAVKPEHVNFVVSYGRGMLCAAISRQRRIQLRIPPMVAENTSPMGTNFTITVDAAEGATTGISCADRALTLNLLADPDSTPEHFSRPGHISPVWAKPGGVLERPGHTEGVVDLCRLSGQVEAGMMCEIMNDDGTMARMADLERFSEEHGIPICTIHDLITWRVKNERHVESQVEVPIQNTHGLWTVRLYEDQLTGEEHICLIKGSLEELAQASNPLVRVHSQCFTGDTLGSLRCDCGPQLQQAMEQIAQEGCGAIVYMAQEGRGIGLRDKLRAYVLQDSGRDTVEANLDLGYAPDLRHYGACAQILMHLNVRRMRLLTNNPEKIKGLQRYGLEVERASIEVGCTPYNQQYLKTKKTKMGHILEEIEQ
ncbi:GTP cyclohydrolase II [Candidatus Sumerlaeota bacterium]|nr:GTP cyclohydrolase II [Candidatus Sumerlaeota bacterium]